MTQLATLTPAFAAAMDLDNEIGGLIQVLGSRTGFTEAHTARRLRRASRRRRG